MLKTDRVLFIAALLPGSVTGLLYLTRRLPESPYLLPGIILPLVLFAFVRVLLRLGEDENRPLLLIILMALGFRLLGTGLTVLYLYREGGAVSPSFAVDPGIPLFYLLAGGGFTFYCRVKEERKRKGKWYQFWPYLLPGWPLLLLYRQSLPFLSIIYPFFYLLILGAFIYKLSTLHPDCPRITGTMFVALRLIVLSDLGLYGLAFFQITHLQFLLLFFSIPGFLLAGTSILKEEE